MDNATTQLQLYLHSSWASSVPVRCTCIWTNEITAHGRLQALRPNGFTEETVISDFPVRDKKLTLHIRLVCINLTGTSVNPARSISPALFAGGEALSNVWVFICAPMVGGALSTLVWNGIAPKK